VSTGGVRALDGKKGAAICWIRATRKSISGASH